MATKKKKIAKKPIAKKQTRVAKSIIKGLKQAVDLTKNKQQVLTVYDYRMDLERKRQEFEAKFRGGI